MIYILVVFGLIVHGKGSSQSVTTRGSLVTSANSTQSIQNYGLFRSEQLAKYVLESRLFFVIAYMRNVSL